MLERMRAALRAALPEGAFLKLDRGDALFVTDAPRRGECPDWAGFECEITNGLARLTPGKAWLLALEAEYPEPPDFLCASLRRGGEPDAEVLKLFAMGLKKDPGFGRKLRQTAAARLRKHETLGGLYACGILNYRMERERRA